MVENVADLYKMPQKYFYKLGCSSPQNQRKSPYKPIDGDEFRGLHVSPTSML